MKRSALVLIGLILASGMAFAADVLDPLFVEWGIRGSVRQYLYPQIRYDSNPSVLVDLNDVFIRPKMLVSTRGEFDGATGWYAETDYDVDFPSLATIQRTGRTRPLEFDVGARFFVPVNDRLTVGADLGFDRRSRATLMEQDAGWAGNPDAESTEWRMSNYRVRGTGYGAFAIGGVDLGLKAGASLFRQAGEAQRGEYRTDGELIGVTSLGDDMRKLGVGAAAGTRFVVGNSRIGFGLNFDYSLENSVPWEQDENDPIRIVQITENGAVDEQLDQTEMIDVTINVSFETPLSARLAFLASGDLPIVRRTVTEKYERVADSRERKRTTEEHSTVSKVANGAFSFSLGAGLSWRPRSNIDLRAGAIFTTNSQETLVEIYDAAGTLSNPDNPSGAPEETLPAETGNGDQAIIEFGHVRAWSRNTFGLDTSITYSPVGPLTLYAGGTISRELLGRWFVVYNSATEQVLEAISVELIRFVHFIPTLGAAFEFPNGTLLSVNSTWARTALSVDWFDQDLRGFPLAGDLRQRAFALDIDVVLRL